MKNFNKNIYLILVLAGVGFKSELWSMTRNPGLYHPGSVGAMKTLQPPKQIDDPTNDSFLVRKGLKLHKFEVGHSQGKVALFIHGGPCAPFDIPVEGLKELSKTHRIIYYHQRGCGKSQGSFQPVPQAPFFTNMMNLYQKLGLNEQLADIERIRRIVKSDKITLIGHSFGAFLATLYGAEFPTRVEKMILVAPANVIVFPTDPDLFDMIEAYLPESQIKAFRKYKADYLNYGILFSRTEEELNALQQKMAQFYVAAISNKYPEFKLPPGKMYSVTWTPYAFYFGLGEVHDYREFLKRIEFPSLVLHGKEDIQPEPISKQFASYIKGSQFSVVDHSSHNPFVENPAAFSKAILDFLN